MFYFMNLCEAFNNKHLKHLDFKKDAPEFVLKLAFTTGMQNN